MTSNTHKDYRFLKHLQTCLVLGLIGGIIACDEPPRNIAPQAVTTADSLRPLDSMALDTQWLNDTVFRIFQHGELLEEFRRSALSKKYADFPVSVYKGKKAPLNYQSHPIAREYRTVITSQYRKESVNFAGHYIIADWRCGAPCFDFAIIDVQTGKVYYPNLMNSGGFDFRPDSKLLMIGEANSLGWYPTVNTYPVNYPPGYYLWEDNRMKLLSGTSE